MIGRATTPQISFDGLGRPSSTCPTISKLANCACTCWMTVCTSRKRRSNGLLSKIAVAPAALIDGVDDVFRLMHCIGARELERSTLRERQRLAAYGDIPGFVQGLQQKTARGRELRFRQRDLRLDHCVVAQHEGLGLGDLGR